MLIVVGLVTLLVTLGLTIDAQESPMVVLVTFTTCAAGIGVIVSGALVLARALTRWR